jgi:hypothetical protein
MVKENKMTSTQKLNAGSPEIMRFMESLETPRRKRSVTRSKYVAIDYDNGPDSWYGVFLVDRLTHDVYTIKGYGVRGYHRGTLESLTTA